MPRRESKFVNSYFSKPWIQPLLATFDTKKTECTVKPGHVVAQIIKVKEGCPESLGETDQDIYGSADLHDSYVRASAVFTQEAIEEFEKYEELLSGCEYEHLPNAILVLKKFHIIPKITSQLCDCNLVICIEDFSLWSNEGPMCTISSLPWARSSCSVAFNVERLWNNAQGDAQEESGTEALTNSELPFSCDDLSQLLAEVRKDSSLLQSSHGAEESQSTGGNLFEINEVASQSQGSSVVGPVTSGPGQDPPNAGPTGMVSHSNHHTPEKSRDSPDGKTEQVQAQCSTSKEGEKDEGLKWRHVHQLASWVFEIHPRCSSSAGDAGEDGMDEVMKRVTMCLEKLPHRDGLADEEGSCDKDGMQGEGSLDVGTKQTSPATRSPFSRRKSRRGKRRSPLVKKPETLKVVNLANEGLEREEKLMFEKISKQLPTTVLMTLSPDDIEPLPQDYDLDDDDYDDPPHFSDVNNNLHLQEWDGEYSEEEPQPSSTKDRQPMSTSTSASERVVDPPLSTPTKAAASRELFAEQVQPPGTGQSQQNVLEEIDELCDSHSKELPRDASTEKEDAVHALPKTNNSQTARSQSQRDASREEQDVVQTPFKMYHLHSAPSPTANDLERVGCVANRKQDSLEEVETLEDHSKDVEVDSVIVIDQSSQSSQDDETQLPASPTTSRQSPIATVSRKSVVNRCLMPSTSSATLSDSSQSDFLINVSGDSDFTILRCSIDDRLSKEHTADGTGDHKEHYDIGSGSDSDIFGPPVECSEDCTQITLCREETLSQSTPEMVESHVPTSPKTSLNDSCSVASTVSNIVKSRTDKSGSGNSTETTDARTTDVRSDNASLGNAKELPRVEKLSRKRKQEIVSDASDKMSSTEKRTRFADLEQSIVSLDESFATDDVPFVDGHRVWTSTQKEVQEIVFLLSSEEENSQRESTDKQMSSAHSSGMCLSGWISKQDMMQTKHRTVSGAEAIKESESEETEVTDTPSTNAESSGKQISEEFLLPSVQAIDSCAVDTLSTKDGEEIVHSLVNSGPSEGSAKDSDKTADFSVTPVLFSSGESTKAANLDGTQQQETLSDKTVLVTDSRDVGEGEHGALFDAIQHSHSLDEEEPMSIDTPEDSLPFNPEDIAFPVSSAEVANKVNSPDDKFTRIKSVSLSSRCIVKETQPETSSVSTPVPSMHHSDRSPTPPVKVTKSQVHVQNVVFAKDQELMQVIYQEEIDKDTSKPSEGNTKSAKHSRDEPTSSHQEKNEQGLTPAEHCKMFKDPIEEPKRRVPQSVLPSKIYMGSVKLRKLTMNKKKKSPVTPTKPSSNSKNIVPKKQSLDAQTTLTNSLSSGKNLRKGRSNDERKTTKDTSPEAASTNDVTSHNIRFTSLRKSPSSCEGLVSKTRTTYHMEESIDRSDGSHILPPAGSIRTERATKGTKSSDHRRKKQCGHEDVERNSLSPVFSLPSPAQDENLPSSLTESVLSVTHLPSSDDSAASVTGEQALLDWCAMYLLESSKR